MPGQFDIFEVRVGGDAKADLGVHCFHLTTNLDADGETWATE